MSQETTIHGFRLSPQQQRIWLLWQEGRVQPVQCTLLIEGNLDKTRLNKALRACIARHEILRTIFQKVPFLGLPLQMIEDEGRMLEKEVDLSALDARTQEA
ncbi:MAG TPA: condensation domain-containing protein, partial [Ktedonobacteraceae bacterium]|nr:condensation domain-containing protein [Ktedonobacteraceae bacterium]